MQKKEFFIACALFVVGYSVLATLLSANKDRPQQLTFTGVNNGRQWDFDNAAAKEWLLDIGFNMGGDTQLYLALGHTVVSVEANVELVKRAQNIKVFSDAIDNGRLSLMNKAIVGAKHESGPIDLWVNTLNNEHSSIFKSSGCRAGVEGCKMVPVETIRCSEIVTQHQKAPYFIKIDIEGADKMCLEDLLHVPKRLLPKYISVEAHTVEYVEMLERMGYTGFKVVIQNYFSGNSGPFGENAMNILSYTTRGGAHPGWSNASTVKALFPYTDTDNIAACPSSVANGWKQQTCWFDFHAKLI